MAAPTPEGEKARARAAKWLRLYLELSGLKGKEFAELLGVSKSHLSEMCSGNGSPGFETLLRLRRRLLGSIDDLYDRDPDERDHVEVKKRLSGMRARSSAAADQAPARRRPRAAGE